MNELLKATLNFNQTFCVSEIFFIGLEREREVIEGYIRERQHSHLGVALFKTIPKNRPLTIQWKETIIEVTPETQRQDSIKEYMMTTSVIVKEMDDGKQHSL